MLPLVNIKPIPSAWAKRAPASGWKLASDRRGACQVAYQIRAASDEHSLSSNGTLLWDSGRVESDQSVLVEYAGPALHSGERVYWIVRVWDETGNVSESGTSFWEMGLLARSDWEPAQWIGGSLVGGVWTTVPLPYLRRSFQVEGAIAMARLYVTALGLYECSFNGTCVGTGLVHSRFRPIITNAFNIRSMTSQTCCIRVKTRGVPCWAMAGIAGT